MTPKGGLGGNRTGAAECRGRAFRLRLPYMLCWNRALAYVPATFCFRIALSPRPRPYFIVRERSRLMLRQAEAEAEADAG